MENGLRNNYLLYYLYYLAGSPLAFKKMTEEEKSHFLLITREMLRQMEPQLDNTDLQAAHDKMIADIAKDGSGSLSTALMAIPLGLAEVMDRNNERITGMRDVINFIEQTEASVLTADAIKARIKAADIGPIGLTDSSK